MMDAGCVQLDGAGQNHLDGQGNLMSDIAIKHWMGQITQVKLCGSRSNRAYPKFQINSREWAHASFISHKYLHT